MFDSAGRRLPTKHNIYVDDNLLAEVKAYMHIMGHPCPSIRPLAVALDKLEELVWCPPREMTVSISDQFRREVLARTAAGKFHGQGA